MAHLFGAALRLAGDDCVGLGHQILEVGRRPGRDEQREQHSRQRRMNAALVNAEPQDHPEEHVGRNPVDGHSIEDGERRDDRQRGAEIKEVDPSE